MSISRIVRRSEEGKVIAVCDYAVHGTEIWVLELEVTPAYRGNGTVKSILQEIYELQPQVQDVVFGREYKYPGRGARKYNKRNFIRRIGG